MRVYLIIAGVFASLIATQAGAWTHGNNLVFVTGLVATRGKVDQTFNSGVTAMMSKSGHFARSDITSIQAILTNFYAQPIETAPGSAATITASIEYPAGVCTAFKFGGVSSGTIPNGGTLTTDSITISIPNGSKFWIRQYFTNASGVMYENPGNAAYIDTTNMGDATVTSGAVDHTVDCAALTSTVNIGLHAPLALIGPTTSKSVCIIGDSIAFGVDDSYNDGSGNIGLIERSIGPTFAYSNIGTGDDQANDFVAGHTQRAKVLPYCSTAIVEYGRNDIYNGSRTKAQLETDLTTIYGYFNNSFNKKVIQSTLLPDTTSTDSWATQVNQSTITAAGQEGFRSGFNTDLTTSAFGPGGGYFDTDSVVGTSTNHSIWNVPTCGTPDGIHPNSTCYGVVQSSGIVSTGAIR